MPLAQALIRCASVTPAGRDVLDVLCATLEPLGFQCERLCFGEGGDRVENLFAWRGTDGPHFCFAGHVDVVPAGPGWSLDPFAAEVRNDTLFGRGAVDMKGGVAAFVAACASVRPNRGTVSLLITGDEEGPALQGTVRVLEWLRERGRLPDMALVGEPTSGERLGDIIKVGRRGSLNAAITVHGVQGHSAYPQHADNPVHRLIRVLHRLTLEPLDAGSEFFEASTLQVTSVDVGNSATNVIPASASAKLNIRFNDHHSAASLECMLTGILAEEAPQSELRVACSGESFLTPPGVFVSALQRAVLLETGVEARLDTGGGTSDARFIARYCPVAELGAVGSTMHAADERTSVAELRALSRLYGRVLEECLG